MKCPRCERTMVTGPDAVPYCPTCILIIPADDYDPHEDPPILINAEHFDSLPVTTDAEVRELRRFAIIYAQRAEEHIEHLVRLLATKGIQCQCTEQRASPQCLIHVHANLPDD